MDFGEVLRAKKLALFDDNDVNRIELSIVNGCSYNCKYCQVKQEAVAVGKKTAQNWYHEDLNWQIIEGQFRKEAGVYVFPAGHDINPGNFDTALLILKKILAVGNRVIITTKPYLQAIQKMCEELHQSKTEILFRFSIGSVNSQVLKYWEPGAPDFTERMEALKWAYYSGFNTSVVCDPILDNRVDELIETVLPYVNGEVRLGEFLDLPETGENDPAYDDEPVSQAYKSLEWQSSENLWKVYQRYKHNSQIKWSVLILDPVEAVQTGI